LNLPSKNSLPNYNDINIAIGIFVNCNWVDTRWHNSIVHIYTQTIHRTTELTTLVGRLSGIRTQSGQTKINIETKINDETKINNETKINDETKINHETKINDDKYFNILIYMSFILWSIRYCCDAGKEKSYLKHRAYVLAC